MQWGIGLSLRWCGVVEAVVPRGENPLPEIEMQHT
jgi:hypothetical protein